MDAHLRDPAFRASYAESVYHILTTVVNMGLIFLAWWSAPGIGWLLVPLWSGCIVRSFILFHDAGHHSLFPTLASNRRWMPLLSAMCITPSDWNVGHALHHQHVGNKEQNDYDWGETVFHTTAEYLRMSTWKRRAYRVVRHPLPFFALAPALTWWVRMRLPFEVRPKRKAAYRFANKAWNTLFLLLRYRAAAECGVLGHMLCGDYLGMVGGVILFHMQHVYDGGYVRGKDEWTLRDASMRGSSLLHVPSWLAWFTCGIEYHHIHHYRTTIPGYRLALAHATAPAQAWKDVPRIETAAQMWQSLQLTLYDEAERTYVAFPR